MITVGYGFSAPTLTRHGSPSLLLSSSSISLFSHNYGNWWWSRGGMFFVSSSWKGSCHGTIVMYDYYASPALISPIQQFYDKQEPVSPCSIQNWATGFAPSGTTCLEGWELWEVAKKETETNRPSRNGCHQAPPPLQLPDQNSISYTQLVLLYLLCRSKS